MAPLVAIGTLKHTIWSGTNSQFMAISDSSLVCSRFRRDVNANGIDPDVKTQNAIQRELNGEFATRELVARG